MEGRQRGHHRIQEPFGDFLMALGGDGIRVHVETHVAHEQQAPARQCQDPAVRVCESLVGIETPGDPSCILFEGRFQRALHDSSPVSVDFQLVIHIDSGDGIFAVLNRGDSGFQEHVFDACRVYLANGVIAVHLDLDMQAVVDEKDAGELTRFIEEARKLVGFCETCAAPVPERRHQSFCRSGIL